MSSGVSLRALRANSAAYLLRDFFTFAKYSGICPDITPEEYGEVCAFLESRLPERSKDTKTARRKFGLFLIPRLCFKTSLVVALCIYAILKDLHALGRIDIRIVLGRANTKMASTTLYGIKTNLESNPVLGAAFGDLRSLFSVWTDTSIVARTRAPGLREPTIDTTGLDTSRTGQHPDLVLLDDLVHEGNYQSETEMERAQMLVTAFIPIIERWGSMVVIGTRWGHTDLPGWIIEQDEKTVARDLPERWEKFIRGAYDGDGIPLFPTPLPQWRIEELRNDPLVTEKLFSAWILNVAHAAGERIFAADRIQYADAQWYGGVLNELLLNDTNANAPWRARFGERIALAVVVLVDPAPTVGPKSDFTGINVVGFDAERNWWALEAHEVKLLPTQRLELIKYLVRGYGARLLVMENADMDAVMMQDELHRENVACKVVSFNPKLDRRRITADAKLAPHGMNSKAAQIEAVEPVLSARRIFFVRGRTAPLTRQMLQYPHLRHDDVLDSFSMAKAYEARPEMKALSDPYLASEIIEQREYELEGLNFDGSEIDAMPQRRAGPAGLLSPRVA